MENVLLINEPEVKTIPTQKEIKIVGKIDLTKFEKKQKIVEPIVKQVKKLEIIRETIIVHFFADKTGKIIGRCDNGKIAIIDFNYPYIIKENEDWTVAIMEDFPKKVIVKPLNCVITQEANIALMNEQLNKLNNKDWNKPTGKRTNVIKGKYEKRYKFNG